MSPKFKLEMSEINVRLRNVVFPDVDVIVGIADGGVVPAALVAFNLQKPLQLLSINYRAEDNTPRHESPLLLDKDVNIPPDQTILLVDDVSVSGKTMDLAKKILHPRKVVTFVLKGKGDLVLLPEMTSCIHWPWNLS
jgi:hypoxanthine phosphoribosyltransferase